MMNLANVVPSFSFLCSLWLSLATEKKLWLEMLLCLTIPMVTFIYDLVNSIFVKQTNMKQISAGE